MCWFSTQLYEREREREQYTAKSPHYIHTPNSHVYTNTPSKAETPEPRYRHTS